MSRALTISYAIAPAMLILCAAAWGGLTVCRAGSDVPQPSDWMAAAKIVQSQKADTELIVFAPDWIDPVGRQFLGDQMSIDMLGRMDSLRFTGIWELSTAGQRSPASGGLQEDFHKTFGPLTLRHYRQTPIPLRYDFTANLRAANVTGANLSRPTFGLQEVGFAPRQCIQVIPKPNQTVSLHFAAVPLGEEIVGYVGLADVFTRRAIRDPGQLELLVNKQSRAVATAGVQDGWVRFSATTKAGTADVEFRLTAVGPNAQNRHICFAAEARQ